MFTALKKFDFSYFVSVQEVGSLHSSERDFETFKDALDLFVSDINLITG